MPGDPSDEAKKQELADALSRIENDAPGESVGPAPTPPPASAAEFRRSNRPSAPPGSAPPPRPAAPKPAGPPRTPTSASRPAPQPPPRASNPTPPQQQKPAPSQQPPAPAKAKPARPQRPDRPEGPPTTQWTQDEAALVAAHYEPLSEVIDDDDVVIAPAPDPEVFMPHPPPAPAAAPMGVHGVTIAKSLAFRRTVIPILLTCGVLLIGIGLLRWVGGEESIFTDMTVAVSAGLCGTGAFLLVVALLNMLQVKAELDAAVKRPA